MKIRHYHHFQANLTDSNITSNNTYQLRNGTIFIKGKAINEHINSFPVYVLILIFVALVAIIGMIAVLIIRKKNRDKFQENPENFSKKPDLSFFDRLAYKKMSVTSPLGEHFQKIQKKNTYEGQLFEVTFKEHNSCIYLDHVLKQDCYFEIQILKLSSYIQIGFVPVENINEVYETDRDQVKLYLDRFGVSVGVDGEVCVVGQKRLSYDWVLGYGDVIGIGLTAHKSSIRVWLTKNGILLNGASEEQIMKNTQLETGAIANKKNSQKDNGNEQKNHEEAISNIKKKIELKKSRKFEYYAVITCEGASEYSEETVINWNIGAHNFRLFDGNALKGLLG